MTKDYKLWIAEVGEALRSIIMPLEEWQQVWPFDFEREFRAGLAAADAAQIANRFWWREQNNALH